MRIARLAPSLLFIVLLAVGAHAQPASSGGESWGGDDETAADAGGAEFARDGFYVSYGYSAGLEEWESTGGASVSNASGLNARVGYRFLKYWALEAEYEWLHEFEVEGTATTANAHVITINTRTYLPLGRIQPYALLGLGLFQSSRTGSFGGVSDGASGTFAGRFGAGVDSYLTRNWVLAAEVAYVLPSGELGSRQFLSATVGVQYRFEPLVY